MTNTTFERCGVARSAAEAAAGVGCGDGTRGCGPRESVWRLLTHSDEHVPEFMQATAGISYSACGTTFRFKNYVLDSGGAVTNGMHSTVSERLQSWLDADGSASGVGAPAILGSAATEAGWWWQLDDDKRPRNAV